MYLSTKKGSTFPIEKVNQAISEHGAKFANQVKAISKFSGFISHAIKVTCYKVYKSRNYKLYNSKRRIIVYGLLDFIDLLAWMVYKSLKDKP